MCSNPDMARRLQLARVRLALGRVRTKRKSKHEINNFMNEESRRRICKRHSIFHKEFVISVSSFETCEKQFASRKRGISEVQLNFEHLRSRQLRTFRI
jgi:hypothetical protein